MKQKRLEYAFMLVSSIALLFFFGKMQLLFIVLLLIGGVLLTKCLLSLDARSIQIQPEVRLEGGERKEISLFYKDRS